MTKNGFSERRVVWPLRSINWVAMTVRSRKRFWIASSMMRTRSTSSRRTRRITDPCVKYTGWIRHLASKLACSKCGIPVPDSRYHSARLPVSVPSEQGYIWTVIFNYLTYLLEKMPSNRMSDEELELLAPWNENVKTEIQHRVNNTDQSDVNCQGTPATEK